MKKGVLSITLFIVSYAMSGCATNIQTPTVENEEIVEQVGDLQVTEQIKEQIDSKITVTKEIRFQQLDDLMMDSREGNVSIEESTNGEYLCGIDYETNHIVVLDKSNRIILDKKLVSPIDDELNLTFYTWGDEQKWLWLTHNRTYQIKDFVKIDLTTGEATFFDQNYGFMSDFALEPNTGYLCFSDAPMIFDMDERKEFLDSNQKVTLKLANLFNKEQPKIIETAISREFCPKWVDSYTFTYNNPYLGINEIEKVTYTFNQSYELLPTLTSPPVYETNEQYLEKCEYILKELKISEEKNENFVTLYGYTLPIKDITLYVETDEWINEKGYVRCIPESQDLRLHLFIDDRQSEDNERLVNFFRLKYSESTVKWLMDKFMNERNSYIAFKDGSYIRFSLTTGGFKIVSIGRC